MKILFNSTFQLLMFGVLLGTISCKKEEKQVEPVINTTLKISLNHKIDSALLEFDTIRYINEAQIKYSITRVNYYVSGITLIQQNGATYNSNIVYYADAVKSINEITLNGIPEGNYTGIKFLIGLSIAQNKTGGLENTSENLNMAWPEIIGGGYHFLKLEGYYLDSLQKKQGFTFHLGSNGMEVHHKTLNKDFDIKNNQITNLNLKMNINEWFRNPYTYNFNTDGNYTMADTILMPIVRNNGYDVFSIQ